MSKAIDNLSVGVREMLLMKHKKEETLNPLREQYIKELKTLNFVKDKELVIQQYDLILETSVKEVDLDIGLGRAVQQILLQYPQQYRDGALKSIVKFTPRKISGARLRRCLDYINFIDEYGSEALALKKLSVAVFPYLLFIQF